MSFAPSIGVERVQLLMFERDETEAPTARYFVLSVEPSLLGDTALVRERGGIGQHAQRRIDLVAALAGSREDLSVWLRRKLRRVMCSVAKTD
jgi:hypothetical protein